MCLSMMLVWSLVRKGSGQCKVSSLSQASFSDEHGVGGFSAPWTIRSFQRGNMFHIIKVLEFFGVDRNLNILRSSQNNVCMEKVNDREK